MHFHTGIDQILFIGAAAILVRAIVILAAAKLAQSDGMIGQIGQSLGAIAK